MRMAMMMKTRKRSKNLTLTTASRFPMEMASKLLRKKKKMEQTIVAVTIVRISTPIIDSFKTTGQIA